jgi:6-phosphogluconate dehydrogenase
MGSLSDIGLIGLAVMGENIVLNMESKGFRVAVYNRSLKRVDDFIAGRAKGKNIIGTHSIPGLITLLKRPRKIMIMIKAGDAVDSMIDALLPHLEPGDIIIDGGNSLFQDTIRRTANIESKGFLYIGTGISGGEEGALMGPSIMPGGSEAAWPYIKPIFQTIAAKVEDGTPCCDWIGANGAGHFVKMIHNGIEYGDMQLISEAYHILRDLLHLSADEMHRIFIEWNEGDLDSYLIEITAGILAYKDDDGLPLVDKILDKAGQKGTGKWTAITALDMGIPLTLIGEAVFSRCLSAAKEERVNASKILKGPENIYKGDKAVFIDDLKNALYASKIVSYAQGYSLMRAAAQEFGWKLNYGGIALLWRGGCIIRSVFLGKIKEAYENNPSMMNLLLDDFFKQKIEKAQAGWRKVVSASVLNGIPVPALSSALAYFDAYRCKNLPANLLQAQRDYFGAHTYERTDRPGGIFFHTDWTGRGGKTSSTSYDA